MFFSLAAWYPLLSANSYFIPHDPYQCHHLRKAGPRPSVPSSSVISRLAVSQSALCLCGLPSRISSASRAGSRCEGIYRPPVYCTAWSGVSIVVDFGPGALGLRNTGPAPLRPRLRSAPTREGKPSQRLRSQFLLTAPTAIGALMELRLFVDSWWSRPRRRFPPVSFRSPSRTALGTIRGFPATARPLTSRSPRGAPPLPGRASLDWNRARCSSETKAMEGPGAPGVPAARWKRHIVRQLRQRDRTQKALFLELVPACECTAPGDRREDGAPARGECLAGSSGCDSSAPMPFRLRSLGPSGPSVCYAPSPTSQRSYLFRFRLCGERPSWTELPPGSPALPRPSEPGTGWASYARVHKRMLDF